LKDRKKLILLPIPTYIYKFLQHPDIDLMLEKNFHVKYDAKYGMILNITNRIIPVSSPGKQRASDYFDKNKEYSTPIYFDLLYPTEIRVYNIALHLQFIFKMEVRKAMSAGYRRNNNALRALKSFFEECDITEEDFKVATAYKDWQRLKIKRSKIKRKWKFKGNMAVITEQ
jgi:hypothetical protein